MNHQRLEERIIAWFEGDLEESDGKQLLEEIEKKPQAKVIFKTYEKIYQELDGEEMLLPSAGFKDRFYASMKEENDLKNIPNNVRTLPRFELLKYAAAILLLVAVGVLIGINITKQGEITGITGELLAIKKEMKSLLKNESTAQRIRAVRMSNKFSTPDTEILKALINTMNSDKSENVRLSAIDALEKFSDQEVVIKALLKALENSEEDFIQIKLIQILAERKQKKALPYLDQIINNKKSSKYLRNEAADGKKSIISI